MSKKWPLIRKTSSLIKAFRARFSRKVSALFENVYIEALGEFATVLFLSNLPFGFLVFSHYLQIADTSFSWDETIKVIQVNWKPGEILVLVSALLAPFTYVMYQYHRARRHMPGYLFFSVALLVIYSCASYIFSNDRLGAIHNENFVRDSSLFLYFIALLIWYFGLVFQRKLTKPPEDQSSDRADSIAAQL